MARIAPGWLRQSKGRLTRHASAAAAHRPPPHPFRAETEAGDGRLLAASLRRTRLAPRAPAGDRRALGGTGSAAAVFNTFVRDVRDPELHELPNVCSHFVISGSGRIFQLVLDEDSLPSYGRPQLDGDRDRAHAGCSDGEVLGNQAPNACLTASDSLPALPLPDEAAQRDGWHARERLSSPYHRERVASPTAS